MLNGYLRGFLKQPRAGNEPCIKMEAAAFVKGKKFRDVAIIHWILKGLIQSIKVGYRSVRVWRFLQGLDLIWGRLDFSK
jgi:hypothetical protein